MEVTVLEGVIGFISGLSAQYPVLVGIFAILYSVGIAFKLLLTALKTYVLESPSKSDDEMVGKLEENKIFKAVKFVMDLLIRLKVK
jgi:hypothetical protein